MGPLSVVESSLSFSISQTGLLHVDLQARGVLNLSGLLSLHKAQSQFWTLRVCYIPLLQMRIVTESLSLYYEQTRTV